MPLQIVPEIDINNYYMMNMNNMAVTAATASAQACQYTSRGKRKFLKERDAY